MARNLPPPLPPEERTVGQLVAETIRAYGDRFWLALPLGVPLAIVDQLAVRRAAGVQALLFWAAAPLIAGAYVCGCALVHRRRPRADVYALALLIYLPFPALRALFFLPGVAWFAFIGLAVPAALVEGLPVREALVRGRRLGVGDYVHALGSLSALVVVVGVADAALTALLRSQGDSSQRVALAIADVLLSPLLYLGGALLYVDQAARVVVSRGQQTRGRRRDADLHPPVDPEPAGDPDPQVEP